MHNLLPNHDDLMKGYAMLSQQVIQYYVQGNLVALWNKRKKNEWWMHGCTMPKKNMETEALVSANFALYT